MNKMMARVILLVCLFSFTYILNIPFGMLRARAKKFSFKWFLYIHAPIPLIFIMRILSGLDYHYIPVFILAAVLGQLMGGKLGG